FAAVENVSLAVAPRAGREVAPSAAGLGFAETPAEDLAAARDRVEEQFLLRAAGGARDHAADAEQMHVDCDRGRGASLRELLLAEREILEVGAESAVFFGNDERGVSGRFHFIDVFDRK